MNIRLIIAATLIAFGTQAVAQDIEDTGPQYTAGSQYSAKLEQTTGRWQLSPIDAADSEVLSKCGQQVYLPQGIWLLNRNRQGNLELQAPSGTALPPGHKGRVQLVSCEAAGAQPNALRAPSTLIDWLAEHTGAIMVER
jgi:hypothetical protein